MHIKLFWTTDIEATQRELVDLSAQAVLVLGPNLIQASFADARSADLVQTASDCAGSGKIPGFRDQAGLWARENQRPLLPGEGVGRLDHCDSTPRLETKPGDFNYQLAGGVYVGVIGVNLPNYPAPPYAEFITGPMIEAVVMATWNDATRGFKGDFKYLQPMTIDIAPTTPPGGGPPTVNRNDLMIAVLAALGLVQQPGEGEKFWARVRAYVQKLAAAQEQQCGCLVLAISCPIDGNISGVAFDVFSSIILSTMASDKPTPPQWVFAHELLHMFGAADEYAASQCECTRKTGAFNIPNCNCQRDAEGAEYLADCAKWEKTQKCIMADVYQERQDMCEWTKLQVAWSGTVPVDHDLIGFYDFRRISVGSDGSVWALNSEGRVFYTARPNRFTTIKWQAVEEPTSEFVDLAADSLKRAFFVDVDGFVWSFEPTKKVKFHRLANGQFFDQPSSIAVRPVTNMPIVSAGPEIFEWHRPTVGHPSWRLKLRAQQDIRSLSADRLTGFYWMALADGTVWSFLRNGEPTKFTQDTGGAVAQVAAHGDFQYFMLQDGRLHGFDPRGNGYSVGGKWVAAGGNSPVQGNPNVWLIGPTEDIQRRFVLDGA